MKTPSFAIVHQDDILEIKEKLEKIQLQMLSISGSKKEQLLPNMIAETEAKIQLNRKSTWFWEMRKSGKLQGKKIGQTWYYRVEDLRGLMK